MSTRPLLTGQYQDIEADLRDALKKLQDENQRLSDALSRAIDTGNQIRNELRELQDSTQGLRIQLSPLYRSLCGLFGELDRVSKETDFAQAADPASKNLQIWEQWKRRVGQTGAKIIDALLTHGTLNTQQLAITTGLHRTTIPKGIFNLNKAGLLNKSGGNFSLKQL